MKPPLVILGFASLAVASLLAQTNAERKAAIEQRERATPSPEAANRKACSLAQLKQEGVPAIEHLPVIEDSTQAKTRTREEVAQRAIAICLTAVKGEGIEQKTIDGLVKKFGADPFFSSKEAAFIHNLHPTAKERTQFSWRYEDYWVLLWALGYVDKLDRPEAICNVKRSVLFLRDRDTATFIRDAKLRPVPELLDQADLIYRYDWAVVNARVKGEAAPAKLEGGVVQERHYVLNWLIGYLNQAWDDVSPDT